MGFIRRAPVSGFELFRDGHPIAAELEPLLAARRGRPGPARRRAAGRSASGDPPRAAGGAGRGRRARDRALLVVRPVARPRPGGPVPRAHAALRARRGAPVTFDFPADPRLRAARGGGQPARRPRRRRPALHPAAAHHVPHGRRRGQDEAAGQPRAGVRAARRRVRRRAPRGPGGPRAARARRRRTAPFYQAIIPAGRWRTCSRPATPSGSSARSAPSSASSTSCRSRGSRSAGPSARPPRGGGRRLDRVRRAGPGRGRRARRAPDRGRGRGDVPPAPSAASATATRPSTRCCSTATRSPSSTSTTLP